MLKLDENVLVRTSEVQVISLFIIYRVLVVRWMSVICYGLWLVVINEQQSQQFGSSTTIS